MDNSNSLPIPTEILEHIFNYLSVEDWKTCCAVCDLWHRVLRGKKFQRRYRFSITYAFKTQLPEAVMQLLQNFQSISLYLWEDYEDDEDEDADDDDDDDEIRFADEQNETDKVISLKRLFEPTPESYISDLLFRPELDFESLELGIPFESYGAIIGNSLGRMKNLRELIINFYAGSIDGSFRWSRNEWIIQHDRIEKLTIDSTMARMKLTAILPNLKTLTLCTDCRWAFQIIEAHCTQLQSLDVDFEDAGTMHSMLSLKFPNLTHLKAHFVQDAVLLENYKLIRNNLVDREIENTFIREMPRLKKLFMESNLLLYRLAGALSRHAHQLAELTLKCLQIDHPRLRAIEAIPNLKAFHLIDSVIVPTHTSTTLTMPLLVKLSINDQPHVLYQLCCLKSLSASSASLNSLETLHKICRYLHNLEQLELVEYSKFEDTAFQELHQLKKLVLFRLCNYKLNTIHWSYCSVNSNIRRIVLNNCHVDMIALLSIPFATLFPGLKELYLDSCKIVHYCTPIITANYNSTSNPIVCCIQQLHSVLPNCAVSLHGSFITRNP